MARTSRRRGRMPTRREARAGSAAGLAARVGEEVVMSRTAMSQRAISLAATHRGACHAAIAMSPGMAAPARRATQRRGVVLLEVVVALSILLLAMAMIGAAVRNTDNNARKAVDTERAMMLAEQVITYYDTGQYQDQREVSAAFGDAGPPNWGYSFKLEKDPN